MENNSIKYSGRWSSDDYRHLKELWFEGYCIEEIAETLEKTTFSIICQIPWKLNVKLSNILSKIEEKEIINKTIEIYSTDYPELTDIEIDTKIIESARKQREKERNMKFKKIEKLLDSIEFLYSSQVKSGLEELVLKVFNQFDFVSINSKQFKERLIWIAALSLLFTDFEYEVLYTVYPNEGGKKLTYDEATKKLEVPKHQVERACRGAVRRLIMMVDLLSDNSKRYNKWIKLDKLTYANLLDNNEPLKFPTVELRYDMLPTSLTLIESFEFNKTEISKLQNANIFCIGNLSEYEYQDFRFNLGLDANISRKLVMLKEAYLEEEKIA